MKPVLRVLFYLAFAAVAALPLARAQREKLPAEDLDFVEKTWPEAKKTQTGIRYIIMREGTGAQPKPGDKVSVAYVGRLLNGQIFDQSPPTGELFKFRVKRGDVIEGWEQILPQMKVGEKRLVIIPPELAYGTRGQLPRIPRNATLVFEIELKDLTPAEQ